MRGNDLVLGKDYRIEIAPANDWSGYTIYRATFLGLTEDAGGRKSRSVWHVRSGENADAPYVTTVTAYKVTDPEKGEVTEKNRYWDDYEAWKAPITEEWFDAAPYPADGPERNLYWTWQRNERELYRALQKHFVDNYVEEVRGNRTYEFANSQVTQSWADYEDFVARRDAAEKAERERQAAEKARREARKAELLAEHGVTETGWDNVDGLRVETGYGDPDLGGIRLATSTLSFKVKWGDANELADEFRAWHRKVTDAEARYKAWVEAQRESV